MLAECEGCGTRFAPDLLSCPHCGLERAEDEMAKIITGVGPSYPEGHAPGDGEEHVHPVADAPEAAPEAPEPAAEPPVPEAESPAPPRVPPRRTPPGAPGD